MTRRFTAAVAALAIVSAAGCSNDSNDNASDIPAFPAFAPTVPASTTTTLAPEQCVAAIPVTTEGGTAVGDFDGDAIPDTLTGAPDSDGRWVLAVALSSGGTASVALDEDPGPAGVTPYGVLPIATTTGGLERALIASIGTGASTITLTAFVRDECGLVRVLNPGGNPVFFSLGGSVTYISGISCEAVGTDRFNIIERTATSADGETYELTAVTFGFADGALAELARATKTLSAAAEPAAVSAIGDLDCPGLAPLR